ncbi:MAG TPA: SHOCT domain-containing protein [Burkholderiaceae bacterium]|jgi:putative membrane protein|nr:SHOCT domain-containing protein [Burkholderiaceae bacterium]HRP29397.1 SHOCT domain-containing protein [Burkholderiaceae bacterium]
MHMFYNGGYFMGGMHALWWLFWIVLIGALLYVGFGRRADRRNPPRETALEVLQRRLAAGEITPQQYEERKALLDRDGAGKA